MKLVTTNTELRNSLNRLIENYPHIAFAVAWASANTDFFRKLINKKSQICKAVIGTHFYQTDPDVLDQFIGSQKVRFMLQPNGVFHPKVYIFWNEEHWEMLIGSANLTSSALNHNSEVMILISDTDEGSAAIKDQIFKTIENYWKDARTATSSLASSYRACWLSKKPALQRLSGYYGKVIGKKLPIDSSLISMTWQNFFEKIRSNPHRIERCSNLLKLSRSAFNTHNQFKSMEIGLRKTIAGLPNRFYENWGCFGSMRGAGCYHQAINDNNPHISDALDKIPLNAPVAREHYEEYLENFIKAFPNGKHGVGVASRLLALKRPDQFVCFNARNREGLCNDFGISQTGVDYKRYWEEIIERIMDSVWWNEPRPNDSDTATIWDGRAAMLDVIFYQP